MSINLDAISAINIAQIALSTTQDEFTSIVKDLASGSLSSIDISDVYVADKLETDTNSRYTAIENAQQAANLTGVASGSLTNVGDMLGRIQELATKAANDVYSDDQRVAIQAEIDQLSAQINQTIAQAKYNDKTLLNIVNDSNPDKIDKIAFQVGVGTTQESIVEYDPNMEMQEISFDVSTVEGARETMGKVEEMMEEVSSKQSEIAVSQKKIISSIDMNMTAILNNQSSYSQISDTDYASSMIALMQNQTQQSSLLAVLSASFGMQSTLMDLIYGSTSGTNSFLGLGSGLGLTIK